MADKPKRKNKNESDEDDEKREHKDRKKMRKKAEKVCVLYFVYLQNEIIIMCHNAIGCQNAWLH